MNIRTACAIQSILHAPKPATTKKRTTKKRANPEAEIQRAIVSYLRLRGYLVVRVNSSVLPSAQSRARVASYIAHSDFGKHTAGHPDLVAYKGSNAIFFEVKAPRGRTTDSQEVFLEALDKIGAESHIVRSVEEVQKVLDGR